MLSCDKLSCDLCLFPISMSEESIQSKKVEVKLFR